MAKCIVIGGGLAGLSSSIYLQRAGHQVELIEASPKFGGRTYSFFDRNLNIEIDNGQHIMMGAYKNTLDFLKILDAENIPIYQSSLSAKFIDAHGNISLLKARSKLYPFNLIIAVLKYSAISLQARLKVITYFSLLFMNLDKVKQAKNVREYLRSNFQDDNIIKSIWEIIGVGALNTKLEEADINIFRDLIKKIFFNGNKSSTFILPNAPLNELFITPSVAYFEKNKIKYSLSETVLELLSEDSQINRIITSKREITGFDHVIMAVPYNALLKLNYNNFVLESYANDFELSPIITIHIKMKSSFMVDDFIGLIDSKIHWVFKNKNHISLVISAAEDIVDLDNNEIIEMVFIELRKYFNSFKIDMVEGYKVLKSKNATFKVTPRNEQIRKELKSNISNLFFVGDWTDTGLPATIEGAILSGRAVTDKINAKF